MMIRYTRPASGGRRTRAAIARCMASAVATRMLSRSISWDEAAPTPKPSARERTCSASLSRMRAGRILLSRRPRTARHPAGNATAAATTGPASGPRPASSTPTRSASSAQAARSRFSEGRGGTGSALALLPDARGLAAQRAEVVELGPAHPAAAHQLHRGDRRAVHGEQPLDADAGRHLPDREVLADAAAPLGDDQTLEGLEPLLVALADRTMTRMVSPGSNAGMSVRKPSRATSASRSIVSSALSGA